MEMIKLFHKDRSGMQHVYNLYKIGPLYYFRGILLYSSNKDIGCSYCEIYRNPEIRGECHYSYSDNEEICYNLLCRMVNPNQDANILYPNKMELLISSYIRANKLYDK